MHRRNFIKLGLGTVTATALVGLVPIRAYDGYQAFLDSIGGRIHRIVLRECRPMESVVIDPPELDGERWYRPVRVYLEGQVEPHKWCELVTY